MKSKFFHQAGYKYFLLIAGMILTSWLVYIHILFKPLSPTEIDQLVMQATFGQDKNSFDRLKTAAGQGQVEAQMAVGKTYMFKHQSASAVHFLDQAAQQGNVEAETLLAKLYFHGDQQLAKNENLALKYFERAFQHKDPVAAYYLGMMYKNGYAVVIEKQKANDYFEFAAQHHIPSAMFMLANAYQYGDGKPTDLKQAYYWYKEAAELELPEAIQELAHIYQYGNAAIQANPTAYQQQMLEIGHSLKHPALTP